MLDEADRMLDKGFENDIRNIISNTRPMAERQTMMCKSYSLIPGTALNLNTDCACILSQCNLAGGCTPLGKYFPT